VIRDRRNVINIYQTLYKSFGRQHWWPAETPFEVIVGAVLTQNTAWRNVEKAIENLKRAGSLTLDKFYKIPVKKLAKLIRPAGYFNIKASRLKALAAWLKRICGGRLNHLKKIKKSKLRSLLLNVYGVGPETADSILLYALNKKSFVVDAYTRRVFTRHGFISGTESYDTIKNFFEQVLPESERIYNEFHALIVKLGKDYCRKKPLCSICPLEGDLMKMENVKLRVKNEKTY
jgi:endonuclease-3 related protein